ncbi:hypothetical protein D3C81_2341420 [compost metagenome]
MQRVFDANLVDVRDLNLGQMHFDFLDEVSNESLRMLDRLHLQAGVGVVLHHVVVVVVLF